MYSSVAFSSGNKDREEGKQEGRTKQGRAVGHLGVIGELIERGRNELRLILTIRPGH